MHRNIDEQKIAHMYPSIHLGDACIETRMRSVLFWLSPWKISQSSFFFVLYFDLKFCEKKRHVNRTDRRINKNESENMQHISIENNTNNRNNRHKIRTKWNSEKMVVFFYQWLCQNLLNFHSRRLKSETDSFFWNRKQILEEK